MEQKIEEWAREWDCRAYVFKHKFGEEVLVEEPDNKEAVLYELESNGLHCSVDAIGTIHIDVDEFEEYLEDYV